MKQKTKQEERKGIHKRKMANKKETPKLRQSCLAIQPPKAAVIGKMSHADRQSVLLSSYPDS